jgi:hypothetical protein
MALNPRFAEWFKITPNTAKPSNNKSRLLITRLDANFVSGESARYLHIFNADTNLPIAQHILTQNGKIDESPDLFT